jgi:HAD superfamily hydrolase (TIGR01450 family)
MPVPQEISRDKLLASYDAFLFDADGVLWLDENVIVGAVEALNELVAIGKRVFLISNNSTKTPAQFVQKVNQMGFTGLNELNIVNAGLVTTHILAQNAKKSNLPVYLCGTKALSDMFEDAGVRVIGVGADPVENYTHVSS